MLLTKSRLRINDSEEIFQLSESLEINDTTKQNPENRSTYERANRCR